MSAVDDRETTITWLTEARFRASPQVGVLVTQDPAGLLRSLTWPRVAVRKDEVGAWCPCALEGGRVRGGSGLVSLLVGDVDDCGPDGIERSAAALAPYGGAVVPTFSATPEKPKHRIIVQPSRPLLADEFPVAWSKFARTLADVGIVVDRGCKNINRLYFGCATPALERWAELGGARMLGGEPVDVEGMLAVAREEAEDERRQREERARSRRPVREEHRDRYIRGAIEKARGNVAGAPEGARHEVLLRESFSLARLGLDEGQIADVLLEPFVAAAGERRRREGERAIRDAVSARGAA